MNTYFSRFPSLALLFLAMALAIPASAQSAGQWMGKIGINNIDPKVSSGNLSGPGLPGVQADVGSAYAPIFSGIYMITDHVSTQLVLGLPYRHDLIAAGALQGVGKIGSVQQLPPTLFIEYRFLEPEAKFRPYVGLGLTYAYFRDGRATSTLNALLGQTTVDIDSRFGVTPHIGATLALNEKWFVDIGVSKTFIKTTATLTSAGIKRTVDTKLDPISANLSIGYKF